MQEKMKSLSSKIILVISFIFISSILIIFSVFEKMNKEAFYSVEIEKANLVVRTIEPLIALNIYLGMESRIDSTVLQLIENPNILAVKVLKNNKIINEKKSREYNINVESSFIIEKNLFQPNSKNKIGSIILVYSSKNYEKLIDRYRNLLMKVIFAFSIFFLLFGLYVKKLLSPLKNIAKSLKNYSPDQKINIPYIEENNEIGLISQALNNMQQSILQYSEQQQNINRYLEDKVSEKTLKLRTQLYTNSLTKLPNRLSLLHDINIFKDSALLIINIDDFKEINDFFGLLAGDNVLIAFAHKLESMLSMEKNITLIHLSGDEFALFFMEKPSLKSFVETAKTLILDIEKMVFFHEENELSIRATLGGAFQTQEALEKADIALKSAKKRGKSFLLYDEKLNVEQQYKNNIEWVKKINIAIEKDKIVPFFQPIYDNKTNAIVSCECLIRLIDENNNVISPFHFLSIAKKSKLYVKLTKIMIEKSCRYFEHLDCDFSLNLSVEDMLDEDIVNYIKFNIKRYNVSKKIVFEILETEGIESYEEVSLFIDEMKSFGCRIAIDDFGSGYSNFAYLLQLNIDYIKIDGSLIKNLDKDLNARMVVETIVSFAQKLNVIVIAEYVHNEEIHKKVKELNIDRSQGFHLAEPQEQLTS
ncbi:MAG: diguanylate cyclase (GGDEF)-like protein [Sulfurimonas sp.]|jgi:diguanylate cyclase (GGDEF)-like protein|uniref:EAL domain-containing protein n=1 Tax=Sulfurimonas sp. TaxID=2022749 RepID=UPI0039E6D175